MWLWQLSPAVSWFPGDGIGRLCDFKARPGRIGRRFVVAPSVHKASLIGLHLIQTCRNTVPVNSWHNGFEDFVGTSGSLHNGCLSQWELWRGLRGVGRAVLKARFWSYAAVCLWERQGQTGAKKGERCCAAVTDVGPFPICRPVLHGLLCVLCVVFLLEAIVGLVTLSKLFG